MLGDRDIHEVLRRVREHCERATGRLEPEELERLADLLLRLFGPDPEYPIRTSLEHRTQSIHSLDDLHDPVGRRANAQPAALDTGPSLQALISRLLVAAKLVSRRQRQVARLHLYGHTLEETAELLGVPLSTVTARWRCAKRSLQRALRDVPPADWLACPCQDQEIARAQARDTFREDQCRCCYSPPRHCPRGKERCRTTGVCGGRGTTRSPTCV